MAEQPTLPLRFKKNQPCGCVLCTCEDPDQCSGCGAKHCGTHPVGEPAQPYLLEDPVRYKHKEAFCLMQYASRDGRVREVLWNSRDGVTPLGIHSKCGNHELLHVNWEQDICVPGHMLRFEDRYFTDMTPAHAARIAAERLQRALQSARDETVTETPVDPVAVLGCTPEEFRAKHVALLLETPGTPVVETYFPTDVRTLTLGEFEVRHGKGGFQWRKVADVRWHSMSLSTNALQLALFERIVRLEELLRLSAEAHEADLQYHKAVATYSQKPQDRTVNEAYCKKLETLIAALTL